MNPAELLATLVQTDDAAVVARALHAFEGTSSAAVTWKPVGNRRNNSGTIEVAGNMGRALVERVTNGIDAVLESEHQARGGLPVCTSPREAGHAWLGVPDDGLGAMTTRQRQVLANRVVVTLRPGEGPSQRCVEIADSGIGLTAEEMPRTILSLNEENKTEKDYLAGRYGQGGSATLAASKYTLIYSRKAGSPRVAFTVVTYHEPPPDRIKGGRYVYLTLDDQILEVAEGEGIRPPGTTCKHFAYDLSTFSSPIGPHSVYGLLQQVLFDPIMPVWLDNQVNGWRRVIKGSRNALNGAVDEGDDSRAGPTVSHRAKMFHASLGEFGRLGIEYWVLPAPEKNNKRPSAAFVDPHKPIVITLSGQNQGELPVSLIRRDAELPYLAYRLICHLDCNSLTPVAQRGLLVSNREGSRGGVVEELIRRELIQALRSDDELARLNAEAKEGLLKNRDESSAQTIRNEVAKLLRIQGFDVGANVGATAGGGGEQPRVVRPRPTRPKPPPIEIREPPTYVRIVWPEDEPISLFPGQRRYLRIETDAHSKYHDSVSLDRSRFNVVIVGDALRLAGTTPLQGGRMRVMVDCLETAAAGGSGEFRIELSRVGQPLLSDSRSTAVVERPKARETAQRVGLPQFRVVPVEPDSDPWIQLEWPDDVLTVASQAERDPGGLVIYYSTAFPKFATIRGELERRDAATAVSFTRRYEIWLAVHSLILEEDKRIKMSDSGVSLHEDQLELLERAERCRVATLAAMVASRELQLPDAVED